MFTLRNAQSTRLWLGYLGLIPFVTLSLLSLFSNTFWPLVAFSAYSCAILSFLAGSLWGQMLNRAHPEKIKLMLFSNGFTLLAWAGLMLCLFYLPSLGLFLLTLVFLTLYALEHGKLFKYFGIDELVALRDYLILRGQLTAAVALCHLIALASTFY